MRLIVAGWGDDCGGVELSVSVCLVFRGFENDLI